MQTICFIDIDSTLVENRFSRRALGALLQEIRDQTGIPVADLAHEMSRENERRQREDPDNPLTMDWDDIIEQIAARHGASLSQRGIDLWRAYAHPDAIDVLDEAPSMLARLRDMGCTLVVATKGLSKYQDPILQVTGLAAYFDDVLTPDRTGYLKTSPDFYARYTADRADKRFVQIGDHYYDDVICPVRNGFISVLRFPLGQVEEAEGRSLSAEVLAWRAADPLERVALLEQHTARLPTFPKDGTDVRPHAVVQSLQEIPALLERLA
ncbi:MAG: HAD family hydrolase [Anaerolineae bacterium]|nr:HAD family hydrolase [Anaerolineae bacterium]MDW8172338.1 HAD family hydrolase [Anaerolineae bacterium]